MKNGMYLEDGNTSWYHADTLHNLDGPAIMWENGTKEWYAMGMRHRENGPAFEMPDGHKEWYLRGRRHRDDGPAIERPNGSTQWWSNDRLHREDGPAIEDADGHKEWWVNGKQHREDGPAIIDAAGREHYFLNGTNITEQEFKRVTANKVAAQPPQEQVEKLAQDFASLDDDQMSQVLRVASRMKSMRATAPTLESIAQAPVATVAKGPEEQTKPTFLEGLRKDLRDSSEGSMSMTLAYGIKDMVTKGAGLKKNKFLKLGTAAGAVALIAATPAAPGVATGAVVLGSIMTIAAAIHTTVVAAHYTGGFLAKKIKESFTSAAEQDKPVTPDGNESPTAKNQREVMSSIAKLRSDMFNADRNLKNGLGFTSAKLKS